MKTETELDNAPRVAEAMNEAKPAYPWVRILSFGGLAIFLMILGMGLYRSGLSQVQSGMAPDFELTTFEGQTIRLSDFRGQVLVINFWASWCVPCRAEAPVLEQAWRDYRDRGVVFIGVDYLDPEPDALAYLREFNITYPNGPDIQTRISQAYRMKGVPETFFVDRQGRLQGVFIGPISDTELRQRIKELLADES